MRMEKSLLHAHALSWPVAVTVHYLAYEELMGTWPDKFGSRMIRDYGEFMPLVASIMARLLEKIGAPGEDEFLLKRMRELVSRGKAAMLRIRLKLEVGAEPVPNLCEIAIANLALVDRARAAFSSPLLAFACKDWESLRLGLRRYMKERRMPSSLAEVERGFALFMDYAEPFFRQDMGESAPESRFPGP